MIARKQIRSGEDPTEDPVRPSSRFDDRQSFLIPGSLGPASDRRSVPLPLGLREGRQGVLSPIVFVPPQSPPRKVGEKDQWLGHLPSSLLRLSSLS